jgi:hypothetical protein
MDKMKWHQSTDVTNKRMKYWCHMTKCIKKQLKIILRIIQQIRLEEWNNSKTHLTRIGEYGQIARMTNQKTRNGPIAGELLSYKTRSIYQP